MIAAHLGAQTSERNLDRAPTTGKVGVALGQGPQTVHVVQKDNPAVDAKRSAVARLTDCVAHTMIRVTNRSDRRLSRLTVKKNVPPGTRFRRYSGTRGVCPALENGGMRYAVPPYACWRRIARIGIRAPLGETKEGVDGRVKPGQDSYYKVATRSLDAVRALLLSTRPASKNVSP